VGSIKSGLFISLDGVVEAPNSWHFPYFNDEMGAAVGAMMAGNDAMLLGRKTYAEFASYWPTADPDDPVTAQMNGTRKYVVSTTLTDPAWQNSTVVNGDVTAELTRLKQDQQLGTTGSGTLVRWLLEQGLLDELHLLVHPLVIGKGKKLFDNGTQVPLRLLSSATFSTGVLHLRLRSRGRVAGGPQPGMREDAAPGIADWDSAFAGPSSSWPGRAAAELRGR
jgi:dihydrofolate reductase